MKTNKETLENKKIKKVSGGTLPSLDSTSLSMDLSEIKDPSSIDWTTIPLPKIDSELQDCDLNAPEYRLSSNNYEN